MFAERRKHPRLPTLLVGTARIDAAALDVVCTNVSPAGAFFSCKTPPAPSSQLLVSFRPNGPDGPEIVAQVEVVWQSLRGSGTPPGFGAVWRTLSSVDGPAAVRLFAEEALKWFGTEPEMLESGVGRLVLGRAAGLRSGVQAPEPVVAVGLAQAGPEWAAEDDFLSDFNPPTVPAMPGAEERQSSRGLSDALLPHGAWMATSAAVPRPASAIQSAVNYGEAAPTQALPELPGLPDLPEMPDLPVEDDDAADDASDAERPHDPDEPEGDYAMSDEDESADAPTGYPTAANPFATEFGIGAAAPGLQGHTDPAWDLRAAALDSPSAVTWPGVEIAADAGHVLSPADLLDWPQPPVGARAPSAVGLAEPVSPVPLVEPASSFSSSTASGPTGSTAAAAGTSSALPPRAWPQGRPSTGIRGRDLLQDSDSWIPHGDEPSDHALRALTEAAPLAASAPATPAPQPGAPTPVAANPERTQLPVDDPGLAQLRASLASKLQASDWLATVPQQQTAVDQVLAAAQLASSQRLAAMLPAAAARTTAPAEAHSAAQARAAESAASDAPTGDRTEVVDPRHMTDLLAQFGPIPQAAQAALAAATGRASGADRVSASGVRTARDSAVGPRPAAEVLLPRGVSLRGNTGQESAPSSRTPAATPAVSTPATAPHVSTTTATSPQPFAAQAVSAPAAPSQPEAKRQSGPGVRSSTTGFGSTGSHGDNTGFGSTGSHQGRPTASQTEAVGRWAGPPATASANAPHDPPARPTVRTTASHVAQMPAPEAVPLLPFGTVQMGASAPMTPAAETIAASLPDAFSSQLHAAAPVRTSPAASLVAAGVEAAVSGSQRGESTVAYTGRQAQQLRGGAPLQEHTQNLGSRFSQSLKTRAQSSGMAEDWPPDVPRSVGSRYDSLQRLGRGGHGVVYKARDRNLDRAVVLKFLQSNQLHTEVARRYFLREVKLAAGLSHPNILHIYDVAEAEGVLYYAMEFVDGVTLSAYLPGGQALTDQAFLFSVVQQLADALDHAHAAGVLHRDVKPENVLVGRDGIVKLFDFGLARMSQDNEPGRTGDVSQEGSMLIGTPYYMAPEQLMGQPVDGRADQYALGVSLFKMLTGELPFKDGNVYAAHVLDPVPDPLRYNPHLPPAVRGVVEQAMAKLPAARFPSCKALSLALWQALFGQG